MTVQMDDSMGVLDFHPSTDVGVVYLTEADLVEGDTYKSKLNKLTKVQSFLVESFKWKIAQTLLTSFQ